MIAYPVFFHGRELELRWDHQYQAALHVDVGGLQFWVSSALSPQTDAPHLDVRPSTVTG